MLRQGSRVGDAGGEHGGGSIRLGLNDAHDGQVFAACHQLLHIIAVLGFVFPDVVRLIVLVAVRAAHHLEIQAQEILVGIGAEILRKIDVLVLRKLLDHLVQLGAVPQAHGVKHIVNDTSVLAQHRHALVGGLGPAAYFDIVLGAVEITALGQLVEDAGVHHAGHEAVSGGRRADAQC